MWSTAHRPAPLPAAVVRAARRGDLPAFNRMIQAHETLLYTVAYRVLGQAEAACDATQAALAEAYRRRPTDSRTPDEVWLLRSLVSACQDRAGLGAGPRGGADDGEASLQRALSLLPLDLKLAVVLVDVAGLTPAQAAAALDLPLGRLQANVTAARVRLLGELRR